MYTCEVQRPALVEGYKGGVGLQNIILAGEHLAHNILSSSLCAALITPHNNIHVVC